MWRELIEQLSDDYKFASPASEAELEQAEEKLGVVFPRELREFLTESNGLRAHYGTNFIWSAERIVEVNLAFRESDDFRELYMPFDCLLFFGDDGGGDQFGYPIKSRGVDERHIFRWEHENDSRSWCAQSLQRFLKDVLSFDDA